MTQALFCDGKFNKCLTEEESVVIEQTISEVYGVENCTLKNDKLILPP